MGNYILTITERQAETLIQATEVLARLGMGQFRDALGYLPTREYIPEGWHEDMDTIGGILSRHMDSTLGIRHRDVRESSKIAWDLHQVLRHRLAWDNAVRNGVIESVETPRKWPDMMQVFYDDPMRVSNQPLATIEPV